MIGVHGLDDLTKDATPGACLAAHRKMHHHVVGTSRLETRRGMAFLPDKADEEDRCCVFG